MELKRRIEVLALLGDYMKEVANESQPEFQSVLRRAEAENGWFTLGNLKFALRNWAESLSTDKLQQWVAGYSMGKTTTKTIAIIMAGNVPLVGFHDFLSVLVTGNKALAKLSSHDKTLLPFLADFLIAEEPAFNNQIEFTEGQLHDFDAVIATGSNNTSRYFEYYFGKYPHIIRKNRNSVAVLTGKESEAELALLANDIFQYFGLGCRNVSKIYIPEGYDFEAFFKAMFQWQEIIHNNKYINNYDYNKAVYLMDSLPLVDNGFLLLKEDSGFSSPIAVLFYEKYSKLETVKSHLQEHGDHLQCIVSSSGISGEIPFGSTQTPALWDYADNVDTVKFLLDLPS